jgi:hypothetical protein
MEANILEAGIWLACGCCGSGFPTWEGYEHQDQDSGYGICKGCQGSITEHDEEEWDKAFKTVCDGFKHQHNRDKFNALSRPEKKAMVNKMIDRKILVFHIGR